VAIYASIYNVARMITLVYSKRVSMRNNHNMIPKYIKEDDFKKQAKRMNMGKHPLIF
jgi:hypothetical protein